MGQGPVSGGNYLCVGTTLLIAITLFVRPFGLTNSDQEAPSLRRNEAHGYHVRGARIEGNLDAVAVPNHPPCHTHAGIGRRLQRPPVVLFAVERNTDHVVEA